MARVVTDVNQLLMSNAVQLFVLLQDEAAATFVVSPCQAQQSRSDFTLRHLRSIPNFGHPLWGNETPKSTLAKHACLCSVSRRVFALRAQGAMIGTKGAEDGSTTDEQRTNPQAAAAKMGKDCLRALMFFLVPFCDDDESYCSGLCRCL